MRKPKKEANKNKRYNESYNKNYNLYPVRNTSTSRLLESVQQHCLSDCLEVLSKLGFVEDDALVVLSAVQTLQQLGGV